MLQQACLGLPRSSAASTPPARMIHVEDLTKSYGERVLFEDVSWHVKKQDRIGLSGPNGSGKTTLLRMLAGLEEPDAGTIRMASDTTIGYLPQDGIVHHGRTVYDEVVARLRRSCWRSRRSSTTSRTLSQATPRRRRRPRAAAGALRGGHRPLQAPRRLRDRRPGGRRAQGPRLLARRPAAPDRGVLRRLADAHRAGQAAAGPPQPAAHGRAHEPPRPARAQLARGVPGTTTRARWSSSPTTATSSTPPSSAITQVGLQDPDRLPRQLLEVRGRARGAHGAPARGAPPADARRSRRPRPSSTSSATRPPRRARCRAGSSCWTRSSASRSRPSARRSASSSRTRPSPAASCWS